MLSLWYSNQSPEWIPGGLIKVGSLWLRNERTINYNFLKKKKKSF